MIMLFSEHERPDPHAFNFHGEGIGARRGAGNFNIILHRKLRIKDLYNWKKICINQDYVDKYFETHKAL